jgi:SAM-dependent methyltransferase
MMARVTSHEGELEPDTKDWTWVLDRACPECGYYAASIDRNDLPHQFRRNAVVWLALVADPAAAVRTRPDRWSTLEYACHVHDVHQLFHDRVSLMLAEDGPHFPNWDQDQTAIDKDYAGQLPSIVGPTLVASAYAVGDLYASVGPLSWRRRGFRSDGSEFTIDSLARYHLHDVVHHLHDVQQAASAATVRAYGAYAHDYRDNTTAVPDAVRVMIDRFVDRLPDGARVLEIGSGPGRDAVALEEAGLSVRRTDITPSFVSMLRAAGHEADLLDPLTDDLSDPAAPETSYDGVWASACLLHVARADLERVLTRLAEATRPGGLLHLSLKEGDGEGWSIHGNVSAPRFFTYWREEPLRAALEASGWTVDELQRTPGVRYGDWLDVLASRA